MTTRLGGKPRRRRGSHGGEILAAARRVHQPTAVGRHAALTRALGLPRMSRLPSRWRRRRTEGEVACQRGHGPDR